MFKVLKKIKFVIKKLKFRKPILIIGIIIMLIIITSGKQLYNGGLIAGIQEGIDKRFDINAVYAAKDIQEAINNKDYERANDLYVKVQYAPIGSKAYDNLSEARKQIEYYRKYRLAIDAINENKADQDWGIVINYLSNMPNNFKYENKVKSLLETAIERQKMASITPTPLQKQSYVDPDPIINCVSSAEDCKGSSIKTKRSECHNITCCQIGKTWSLYVSSELCKQAQNIAQQQNNQNSNISSNKVPVFVPFYGYTLNCPSQNVNAIQNINAAIESKNSQWFIDYDYCSKRFYENNSCYQLCDDTRKTELNNCYASYGHTGDAATMCINIAWDNSSKCYSYCPSALSECDYVYWERNNLLNQIKNLCK